MIKLDYTLETPEERNELVKKILEENPHPNDKYLEILADYLILCMEKQEKKEHKHRKRELDEEQKFGGWCSGSTVKTQPISVREPYSNLQQIPS